jgi:hypothetical protein
LPRRSQTGIREEPMLKQYSPKTVAPPFSRYSHGVEASAQARWL